MGRGARSKRSSGGGGEAAVKRRARRHTVASAATAVDPALEARYRNTRQPQVKSQLYAELLRQKKDTKRVRREGREQERKALRDAAPAKLIPKTKERLRKPDVTVVDDARDVEIVHDEADDEFASYFAGDGKPRVLITTGEHPCFRSKQLVKELLWLVPNSTYRPRRAYTLQEITQFCIHRGVTDLLVVTDRLKQPYNLIVSHLPHGPTATFRVSNFVAHGELADAATRTEHYPELIFKNFDTRLGRRIARMLECLFPRTRDYAGRAVATFHSQRDYIFLRTHRYIFDSLDAVRIQEMGPRFTLRLLTLQSGTFDAQFGEFEWFRKKEHDADKLEWYL